MSASPSPSAPRAAPSAPRTPAKARSGAALLCPDLRVGPAADLYVEHSGGSYGYGGGTLLHAGNDIRSRGRGPMELRGRRYKRNWMRANQAIYRVGGGVEIFRTEAKLHFYNVGYEYGGSYWKMHDPLSMEIWILDEQRQPLDRVRKGPKVFYCFRDLRAHAGDEALAAPPRLPRLQPGPRAQAGQARHLGRLVGHLPLRPTTASGSTSAACAAASPSSCASTRKTCSSRKNEGNNRSTRIVRLPYRDGPQHC